MAEPVTKEQIDADFLLMLKPYVRGKTAPTAKLRKIAERLIDTGNLDDWHAGRIIEWALDYARALDRLEAGELG